MPHTCSNDPLIKQRGAKLSLNYVSHHIFFNISIIQIQGYYPFKYLAVINCLKHSSAFTLQGNRSSVRLSPTLEIQRKCIHFPLYILFLYITAVKELKLRQLRSFAHGMGVVMKLIYLYKIIFKTQGWLPWSTVPEGIVELKTLIRLEKKA